MTRPWRRHPLMGIREAEEYDEFGYVPRYERCRCIAPECGHPRRECQGESTRRTAMCRPCQWTVINKRGDHL